MKINVKEINGRIYVNTTPHPINFLVGDEVVVVEPSGVLINARPQEVTVGGRDGVTFVKTEFVGSKDGLNILDEIEKQYPGAFIVGSIIAAQAYPGRVLAMTPAPGYERVAPDQKRMNPLKFTIF